MKRNAPLVLSALTLFFGLCGTASAAPRFTLAQARQVASATEQREFGRHATVRHCYRIGPRVVACRVFAVLAVVNGEGASAYAWTDDISRSALCAHHRRIGASGGVAWGTDSTTCFAGPLRVVRSHGLRLLLRKHPEVRKLSRLEAVNATLIRSTRAPMQLEALLQITTANN